MDARITQTNHIRHVIMQNTHFINFLVLNFEPVSLKVITHVNKQPIVVKFHKPYSIYIHSLIANASVLGEDVKL